VAKFLRLSPFKTRRAADMIRGKPVAEARRVLAFSPLRGAKAISKVLESASANATLNFGLDETRLVVAKAFVDEGPTWRRWKPAAHGRANRIRKRTSHITVVVRQVKEES
jgi:large subunit ribosomal protein L22